MCSFVHSPHYRILTDSIVLQCSISIFSFLQNLKHKLVLNAYSVIVLHNRQYLWTIFLYLVTVNVVLHCIASHYSNCFIFFFCCFHHNAIFTRFILMHKNMLQTIILAQANEIQFMYITNIDITLTKTSHPTAMILMEIEQM